MEGVPIKDEMRFCKGDGPSLEFESGNQRGGHYYCSGCKIHADHTTYELDPAFSLSLHNSTRKTENGVERETWPSKITCTAPQTIFKFEKRRSESKSYGKTTTS